ncbi:MAG: GDSL-type esterase/lipase family protein [Alphaproteobacteria bacterium]
MALGDSNIKGKGLLENDAYPAKLERALRAKGQNVTVKNAGINGDTTKGVLSRMNSDVPQGTQIVILSVGINDTFEGTSAATINTNINKIIGNLRARNIEVMYFGAPTGQGNPARRAELEAMGVTVVPALQDGIADDPNLHVEASKLAPNKYHLNSAGYDIVVARTLPQVEALIAKVK